MAGVHLLDEETGEYNRVMKYLGSRKIVLVKLVDRIQGFHGKEEEIPEYKRL